MNKAPETEKAIPELPISKPASPRRLSTLRRNLISWGVEEVAPFSIQIPQKEITE